MESEDFAEQENKELGSRLESLESIVRMLELKHKNSLEHAGRLEERESELKKVCKLIQFIIFFIYFDEPIASIAGV